MNCANHPDRERVAFCQNCGKPLCEECKRMDGNSIFCEPCFVGRHAAPPAGGYAAGGYTASGYSGPGYVPGVRAAGRPEPAIAALLGFIPGVGAMYNEQYAKGIVHLVAFAVLVSLTGNTNGFMGLIFGLFVMGWIFYMVFEAHHTARARRDGTPLPNPFGLNDLGERLGFGRAWPATGGYAPPPYDASAQPGAGFGAGPGAATPPPQGAGQTYAAPGAYYHAGADGSKTYATSTAWFHQGADGSQSYGTGPGTPPVSHWGAPSDVPPPVPPIPEGGAYPRHIPMGAVWLVAIGALLLIGHAPVFRVFHGHLMPPLLLLGLGVWIFVRRMTESGMGFASDGSSYYRWRVWRAANGAVWVMVVGLLWLLDVLHVLSWGSSWPIYLIVAGMLMLLRRTVMPGFFMPPQPGYGAPPPASPAVNSSEIVPVDPARAPENSGREEGR